MVFPFPRPFPGPSMVSFNVLSLFASGEQGAWYDPSDFSTMFQDSAGTTPVSAVEQPVGLILDKSKGLALGAELINNSDNEAALYSGASSSNGTIARAAAPGGGFAAMFTCNAGTFSYQAIWGTVAANTPIKVSVRVYVPTGSITGIQIFDANDGSWSTTTSSVKDSWVTFTAIRPAKATAWNLGIGQIASQALSGQVFYVDDLSVKSLAGNHASQATSTSRPVLSARVNLLTFSEQFDNAAWAKPNATVTANAGVAPDGSSTADKFVEAAVPGFHQLNCTHTITGLPVKYSIWAKAVERTQLAIQIGVNAVFFDLSGGTIVSGTGGTITSVGNGWYYCTHTATPSNNNAFLFTAVAGSANYTGDGTSGVLLWGADLRVTNDGVGIPAYQRVNAATDYDTNGFPLYLSFDGVDDSLSTAAINFGATDKMTVFAGARKLTDAASGMLVELSDGTSQPGSFSVRFPTLLLTGAFFVSRGATGAGTATVGGLPAPSTNVLTGLGDIGASTAILRSNGVQVASDATAQGASNYLTYPLYIGMRAGISNPFNGRLYSLIVRGAASNADQISRTETWVDAKTGAY